MVIDKPILMEKKYKSVKKTLIKLIRFYHLHFKIFSNKKDRKWPVKYNHMEIDKPILMKKIYKRLKIYIFVIYILKDFQIKKIENAL